MYCRVYVVKLSVVATPPSNAIILVPIDKHTKYLQANSFIRFFCGFFEDAFVCGIRPFWNLALVTKQLASNILGGDYA